MTIVELGTLGMDENGERLWSVNVNHSDKQPVIDALTDSTPWMNNPENITRMQFGDVYQHLGFVMAATQDGLTVWSTQTGHGAYLDGKTIQTF